MPIRQRLEALRAQMRARGLHAYLIPSSDPHLSEYVPACWQSDRLLLVKAWAMARLSLLRMTRPLLYSEWATQTDFRVRRRTKRGSRSALNDCRWLAECRWIFAP